MSSKRHSARPRPRLRRWSMRCAKTIGRSCLRSSGKTRKEYSPARAIPRKILSDAGTHDGLYWKTAPGEQDSPIGPLIAQASLEGYRNIPQGQKMPVRGYYFKMLTKQGANTPGGAKDYLVDGKMTGGFAVLPNPPQDRSTWGIYIFVA